MTQTTHSTGCSSARTGRCICAYLAQWDSKPALGETIRFAARDIEGNPIGATVTIPDWTEAEKDPEFWDTPAQPLQLPIVIEDSIMLPGGWSVPKDQWIDWADAPINKPESTEEFLADFGFESGLAKVMGDPLATRGGIKYPSPEERINAYRKARDEEQLRTKYWHGEYKAARRGFWIAVGFASVCAAGLGTVLAWAGVL